jgi:hypothetical protein
MPEQVHQQRNGRRTDPPDDFKSHHVQVFMPGVEESSQQRQRTPRPFDQGGFGGCADLRVWLSRRLPSHVPRRGLVERLDSVWGWR